MAKRLSKQMDECDRREWENNHYDVMKDLVVEKTKTCEPFRNRLLTNQDKILAESTHNLTWGTGLSKWVTENTQHSFWHGQNSLVLC